MPRLVQMLFGVIHALIRVLEDVGGCHRVDRRAPQRFLEMSPTTDTALCDDGNLHGGAHLRDGVDVVATLHAVAINRIQQDFSGTACLHQAGPAYRVHAGVALATLDHHLLDAVDILVIDGNDDTL